MLLNIVILPPKNIRKSIASLTKKLAEKYPVRWRVDDRKLIPHITLFHLLTQKAKLSEVVSAVEDLTKKHHAMKLEFADTRAVSFFLGATAVCTPRLSALHRQTVLALNQFRIGTTARKFIFPLATNLSSKEKSYLKKYGVNKIFEFYWPHITLCMLKNKDQIFEAAKFCSRYKLPGFRADTVAVAEINKYFQVAKIIKKFKLK